MTKTEEKVEELKGILDVTEVKELERLNFRLSDAIREGASITSQATNSWGDGESTCALHGALISAKARGFIK